MCSPIFDFLIHVWIIFTSYFSRTSSAPTVLPLSTASSNIYAARSRTYVSSGTKAGSEPETWKAQKEQFLRHPSLRRSSSHRSAHSADGSQRSDVAPGDCTNHRTRHAGRGKEAECPDSLVPQSVSPHLPAVIVTPCTPSVDSGWPSEENLQFASPLGSPLDMTIASYRAILPVPTILKTSRTPSRRRRDKERSMAKRIRFDTAEAHDILDDLENPFRFSEGSSESPSFSSPENDHTGCYPDSTLLPPESPSPPAAESTIRIHHQRDEGKSNTLAYPWDFSSWTTNTDRIDVADPNLQAYMTSTPPRKHKGLGAHDMQALRLAGRSSYGLGKDLSEAVLELLPYPDVFDLDMYFCEISVRRSLPPPGLGVTSSLDTRGAQLHEFDIGTTALGPAFNHIPDKKDSDPITPASESFNERRNRNWTIFNDNKLTMSNIAIEADVVNYKDVYRHTAYSKPSVIYSTNPSSPPPIKYANPTSNSHTEPAPTFTPTIRPLLAAKSTSSNHSRKPSTELNRPARQRLSPIVLPPPPIVIVSHYPFDSMKPRRNRNQSRSPPRNERNSSSMTSGPKPEDLMGDSDSVRSMESLKARLKEAYDNFSKPTGMDESESESWERVPLT